MAEEIQKENAATTTDPTQKQKKKGFWSKVFKSSSDADKSQGDEEPKNKSFMSSVMSNARQAATKEVMHVAEHEAMKEVESATNNNNGTSQTTSNAAPDTQTSPTDAVNGATSWAKRMVNNAQQKVQNMGS